MTPKQEQFAQLVANGMNQSEAYRQAYNAENMEEAAIYVEAHRLVKNPKVALRIKEIQAEIRDRVQVSAESQTKRLRDLALKAERYDSPSGVSAAINAEKEINKLNGLIVDKVDLDGRLHGSIERHIVDPAAIKDTDS